MENKPTFRQPLSEEQLDSAYMRCLTCGQPIPSDWTVAFKWDEEGVFEGVKHLYDCLEPNPFGELKGK